MPTFLQVDPTKLSTPTSGRGAWSHTGIDFDYRYTIAPPGEDRIGTVCDRSVNHWAVGAGAWAIQDQLISLGYMAQIGDTEKGIWGPKTDAAFRIFQKTHKDPLDGKPLVVDGFFGRQDARALWTPIIDMAEIQHGIPGHILRGQIWWESWEDPGAIGSITRSGIDRGIAAINSKWRPNISWRQSFDPTFTIPYTAKALADQRTTYQARYGSKRSDRVLWDATIANHNSPEKADDWAQDAVPPDEQIETYVRGVRTSIY